MCLVPDHFEENTHDWIWFIDLLISFFCRTRILQGQWLRDPHRRHCCDCSHTYKGWCSVAAHKLIIGDHVLSTLPWCFYLFISPQYGSNYLTFDIVSLVPYDRKLIDTSLLSMQQVMNHLQICKCKKLWIFNFKEVFFFFFKSILISEYYISAFQHSHYNSRKFEFTSSKIRSVSCFVSFQRRWCHLHDGKRYLLSYLSYLPCEFYTTGLTVKVNFGYLQTVRGIMRI